ncbi:MAG: hypothetical protein JRG91_21465 [Deltaproteobacteria bacterium]|nr:hypothetical protein [Deltaproteobacteria bacterium]
MNDMMRTYFDDLISGVETKIRDDPSSRSHRKIFALELARLGSRLYDPSSRVAWCGVAAPFDLLNALGRAAWPGAAWRRRSTCSTPWA